MHLTVGAVPVNQDSSSPCFMLLRIPTEANGTILGGKMNRIWFQEHLAGLPNELQSCNAKPLIAWKGEFGQKEGTKVIWGSLHRTFLARRQKSNFHEMCHGHGLTWFAVFSAEEPETIPC